MKQAPPIQSSAKPREVRIRKSGFVCLLTSGLVEPAVGINDTIPPSGMRRHKRTPWTDEK